jgi:hypothetical protein
MVIDSPFYKDIVINSLITNILLKRCIKTALHISRENSVLRHLITLRFSNNANAK